MAFEKPLKVFLSYSRADDPTAFKEFRDQLISLEDDKVIKIWSDRDIAVSKEWDREIKKELNDCDIFLALTSAAFNASDYIRGIEMQTAWERHAAGKCRMVPIMWRKWRPPERLRALQFLTGLDEDVVNSRHRDDVLYKLTEGIERLAEEMTAGRWAPTRPTLEPVPIELAYLCDWSKPLVKLNALRAPAGALLRPGMLILIGTLQDCAGAFLDRTRAHLPRALDIDIDGLHVPDVRLMDWPPDPDVASDFLHLALESQPRWEVEKKLPEGLTLLKTTTSSWDAAQERVIERLLREWSEPAWILPATRRLLLVVSIITSGRDEVLQKRIEELIHRQTGPACAVVALTEIERDDAVNWAGRPEVRQRCRGERLDEMTDDIRKLYERAGMPTLPMRPLAAGLRKLIEKYRENKAA